MSGSLTRRRILEIGATAVLALTVALCILGYARYQHRKRELGRQLIALLGREWAEGFATGSIASHTAEAQALIRHGADVNARDELGTALQKALECGDVGAARLLIERGASPNSLAGIGRTPPIVSAARYGQPELVQRLLARGSLVDARDSDGRTALMEAKYADIARMLLAAGADPRARDNQGENVLTRPSDASTAALLIRAGADVNNREDGGWTPLMHAVADPDLVRVLLAAGADPTVRMPNGKTAIDHAQRWGSRESARLIRDATSEWRSHHGGPRTASVRASPNERGYTISR